MVGTSKSLVRALTNVFDQWETNSDWIQSPSAEVKEVYLVIDAYIKKHGSASAALNESLKAIHESHVRNSESIPREIFYLEVSMRLVPVLNYDHVDLCLHTYLRPALDSTGYDLILVEKTRSFFKKIVEEASVLADSPQASRIDKNSSYVIEKVLSVYLDGDTDADSILGPRTTSSPGDSLSDSGRVKIIEENASALLQEMALKRPLEYFNILDKHFCIPAKRQKACLLLCQVLSLKSPQFHCITSSPLFSSLIRCLSFDYNLSVISGALIALFMIVGKITSTLYRYLPELFYIFGRLSTLNRYSKFVNHREMAMIQLVAEINIDWKIARYDPKAFAFKSLLNKDGGFDTLYLLSILYGLFPLNVLDYVKLPLKHFQNSKPTIIPLSFFTRLEDIFLLPIYTYIGDHTKTLLKKVIIHPNIINGVTSEEEANDPTRWIFVENDGQDLNEEEILLACLKLNPDNFPSISDQVSLSNILSVRGLTSDSFNEFEKAVFHSPKERRLVVSSLPSARHSVGLVQSEGVKHGQGLRLEMSLPFSSKLSSIPYNDNKSNIGETSPLVQFKKFDFGGNPLVEHELEFEDATKRNSVSSLLSAHEVLYTEKVSAGTNNSANTDASHFATGSIQLAPKGASDLLTKQLKSDAKVSKLFRENSEATYIAGEESVDLGESQKSLEIYQMQILRLQNEIEFLHFLRGLDRLNCLSLKQKADKILRESTFKSFAEDKNLVEAYHDLLETVQVIEKEKSRELSHRDEELIHLNTRIDELRRQLRETVDKYADSEAKLADARQIIVKIELDGAERDSELKELKAEAKLHDNTAHDCQLKNGDSHQDDELTAPSEEVYLDDKSKKEFDMQIEANALREHIKKIASELEKSQDELAYREQNYEKRIEAIKHELSEQMRKSIDCYEQKIREFNIVIVKFETLLEEKNALIMQLSTSRPIRIPSISEIRTETSDKPPLRSDNQGSKATSDYFSRLPSAPLTPNAYKQNNPGSKSSSTQSVPIIKGRGGYQKRIKKIM